MYVSWHPLTPVLIPSRPSFVPVQIFKTEVCDGIIAPGFEPEALEILKNKKKVRLSDSNAYSFNVVSDRVPLFEIFYREDLLFFKLTTTSSPL